MIYIIVTMAIKEGKMDEFLAEAEKFRSLVLKEDGCLSYDYIRETPSVLPVQEAIEPTRITLVERWASPEALKAHSESPHMKDFGDRMRDLRSSAVARVGESVF